MSDLRQQLRDLGVPIPRAEALDKTLAWINENPQQSCAWIVGVSTMLMLAAERRNNPKIRDVYDSLLYCTTCLNTGYAESHPQTPAGKIIASILQTIGAPLSNKVLDRPKAATVERAPPGE